MGGPAMIGRFLGKINRYWNEIRFCWRIGSDLRSRFGLAAGTLGFHFGHLGKNPRRRVFDRPKEYRIRALGGDCQIRMRTHAGDFFVFHEILLDGAYEATPLIGPASRRKNIETVIDLGANIGFTTIYYAGILPQARFLCVEPDPANLELLRFNLAFLGERVRIVEGALSAAAGFARFDVSASSWGGSLTTGPGGIPVRLRTMPELLALTKFDRVDLLKVDIEGAEKDLLAGRPQWLDRIDRIILETHGTYSTEGLLEDLGPGFEILREPWDPSEIVVVPAARKGLSK